MTHISPLPSLSLLAQFHINWTSLNFFSSADIFSSALDKGPPALPCERALSTESVDPLGIDVEAGAGAVFAAAVAIATASFSDGPEAIFFGKNAVGGL
jgi:hypothetical protein